MKKFFAVCFMFIVIGGVIFFFGWANLIVPVGSYGVIRSKTHGLDPRIIQAGEFRWLWYKLIPANTDIQVFTLHSASRSFETRDALPSGSEYASFAGFTIDFSYKIAGTFSFDLKPASLAYLLETHVITDQTSLDGFQAALIEQVHTYILQRLRFYLEDERNIEEVQNTSSITRLNQDVTNAFPHLEHFICFIQTVDFPDFALYHQFRSLYTDYVERIRDYIQTDLSLKPETRVDFFVRLDELTKYGELLSKYPILLQYLSLEKGKP
ncbi:MAG: hypothetical protein LBG87_05560 [Spirochaetaceae bacterium]|jgi:hypothetical protein|nr:hypothetical protein [Spirochaetaceae bacterium]